MKFIPSIFLILFFVFCSERNRTNQYDVTSNSFQAPPCCYTWGQPVYDPYGYLVAVQIGIEYTDPMPRELSFDYKLYFNEDDVLNFAYPVESGATQFGVEITYGGQTLPVGDYCLKIYWGEIGYGAFEFSVILSDGIAKFMGAAHNEKGLNIDECYHINLAQ